MQKIINKDNLVYNVNYLKSFLPKHTLLCAVVKSNAYGHGIHEIVPTLNNCVDYFAVNNNCEALAVRKLTNLPIMTLGKLEEKNLQEAILADIEFAISSIEDLKMLENYCNNKTTNIHLSINSGMNRLGIKNKNELKLIIEKIKKIPQIQITGIYSHIGDAHNFTRTYNQYKKFLDMSSTLPASTIRHLANTETALIHAPLCMDMVRIGIGLYGYGLPQLKPVMQITSNITAIQEVKKGEYIGYGSKHRASKDCIIATIDIGYADGLPRAWSQNGYALSHNKKCPIVANICMNMTIVDVSNIKCQIGDKITVLGTTGNQKISAAQIAKACKTIPYEILTNFSAPL